MQQKTHAARLTADYDKAMGNLFYEGDRSKPMFTEGQMLAHEKTIKLSFLGALLEVQRAAESQKQAADQLEARAKQDLSAHMSDAELQAATLRKPFFKKDAETLDIRPFLSIARQAARSGSKAACLAYLDAMPEGESLADQQAIDDTKETLKQAIIPPDLRNAGQRANQMRLDGEIERVAAKSALFDLTGDSPSSFNPFE